VRLVEKPWDCYGTEQPKTYGVYGDAVYILNDTDFRVESNRGAVGCTISDQYSLDAMPSARLFERGYRVDCPLEYPFITSIQDLGKTLGVWCIDTQATQLAWPILIYFYCTIDVE
jgi:hypothetical protein